MRHHSFFATAVLAASISITASGQGSSAAAQSAASQVSANNLLPAGSASMPTAPDPGPAELNGTVTDLNGDLIPGATIVLDGADSSVHQTQVANDSGFFQFAGLKPGGPYRITISANGFESWTSPPITLNAGQFFGITDIKLKVDAGVSSVTVYSSTE